jgi:predicted ATP-grasp superfamily ATP-dependent carboligase
VPSGSQTRPQFSTERLRVIVTDGEGVGTLAAVRALRSAGYAVWTAAQHPHAYAARSRAVMGTVPTRDPRRDQDGFASDLAREAARLGVAVVLPGSEIALLALTHNVGAFPDAVTLGVCKPDVVRRATDKSALAEHAAAAGLIPPPTAVVRATKIDAREVSLPAVVKPLRSEMLVGGAFRHTSARRIETSTELRSAVGNLPGCVGLVQPYLPGRLIAVSGIFWDGEMICAIHQSSAPSISRPLAYGPSTAARSRTPRQFSPDRRLERGTTRLLLNLGWRGLFQLQFIESAGHMYLIDLNPRIYTSLALAVAAGVNLPAIWVDLLLGHKPSTIDGYRVGVRYRHEEHDPRSLLAALKERRIGTVLHGALPHRRTTHAVFKLEDPTPLLTSLGKIKRKAVYS